MVICHLHRSKLDANREINEATFGVQDAEDAWYEYHGFIRDAKRQINGSGILFDIHGHSHPEDWIELGYLLSRYDLNRTSNADLFEKSSIKYLSSRVSVTFSDLLQGDAGLGGLIQSYGYGVVPSPSFPSPNGGKYYTGGYITRVHGSRDSGHIDAIQIESPRSLRDSKSGPTYARRLAAAIHIFKTKYWNNT